MKKMLAIIALATFSVATVYAQNPPTQQRQGQGQGQGKRQGKKMGPRDGSGPIHNPGTGGSTGRGQRGPRR